MSTNPPSSNPTMHNNASASTNHHHQQLIQQQLNRQREQQHANAMAASSALPLSLVQQLSSSIQSGAFNPQLYNPLLASAGNTRFPIGFIQNSSNANLAPQLQQQQQQEQPQQQVGSGVYVPSAISKDEAVSDSEANSVSEQMSKQSPTTASNTLQKSSGSKRPLSSIEEDFPEDPNERRRRKHNELEVKRRQRINEKFNELQEICSSKPDRRSILQSAIDLINTYSEKVNALEMQVQQLQQHQKVSENVYMHGGVTSSGINHGSLAPLASQRTGGIDFQSIYRNVSAPLAIMSLDGRFIDCNDAMCILFGKPREEIEQTTMFGLANPKDLATLFAKVQSLITGNDHVVVFDTFYSHSTSAQIPLKTIVFSVREQGEIHSLLWLGVRLANVSIS